MQRLQPAPPAASEQEAEPVASLPGPEPVPVHERLELLRLSGAPVPEVDTFLAGLEAPYLPGESPRERADLMLELLEDERLCELTGSTGRRVGLAALETLLRLGYPYAFEVTPAMLERARGSQGLGLSSRSVLGLGLMAVNVLLPVTLLSAEFFSYVEALFDDGMGHRRDEVFSGPARYLPLLVLVLLVPPVLSAVMEWRKEGWRQREEEKKSRLGRTALTGLQAMVGLVFLLLAVSEPPGDFWVYGAERFLLALSGLLAWVTAFCLHPREEPPEP
ncbi:hypothetical protein ATI61_12250 [Archangium gephyra]|uniref:Uncharacterized protein n=1 Tax=Archangium gephyra TaxID=48 RepID=A0AAC8Q051_9BACT|nr:hypothetical protein [Archangium gephyra]AKI98552.1 Hypothetical protein AA314_00179 [Archangium gephyra]REG20350.1 hypothetical protein ATI61_12250 [Archangium gephyra]